MAQALKMSEKYRVSPSRVADEAKVTESILICLMAERSCERHSHLVLVNRFSGSNVENFFFVLFCFFHLLFLFFCLKSI